MNNTPMVDFNETIKSTTAKQRSKKLPTDCKICGAAALYSYVSVVVCPSCKIFFRRNAQIKQVRSNYKVIFSIYINFFLESIQMLL